MSEKFDGIINPPIDALMKHVDSKYQLVIFAAKRARQINSYISSPDQVGTGPRPLIQAPVNAKPLSIALHEIVENKVRLVPAEQ